MPTYDYKCECGTVFEHFQSMKDNVLTTCNCEKKGKVNRMISSGSGIIFKGSGFYVTDYKKSSASVGSATTPKSETTSGSTTTTTAASTEK